MSILMDHYGELIFSIFSFSKTMRFRLLNVKFSILHSLIIIYVTVYGEVSSRQANPLAMISRPQTTTPRTLTSRPTTSGHSLHSRPKTANNIGSRPMTASYLAKTTPLLSPICIKRRARCYNEYCF